MKEYKTELVWLTGGLPKDGEQVREDAIKMRNQLNKTIGNEAKSGWTLQFMTPYMRGNTNYIVLTFEREIQEVFTKNL